MRNIRLHSKQRLAVDLEIHLPLGDGVMAGDVDVAPEPLQAVEIRKAGRAVRLHQQLHRFPRVFRHQRRVHAHAGARGETARLLFCRIMLQKPNVLVLDEPTNHLDLESINALNVALQKYEGTVFLVTHDQDLLEEVGTRVWHFDGRTSHDFKGTYEDYEAAHPA